VIMTMNLMVPQNVGKTLSSYTIKNQDGFISTELVSYKPRRDNVSAINCTGKSYIASIRRNLTAKLERPI
jgi:hypothetical protein